MAKEESKKEKKKAKAKVANGSAAAAAAPVPGARAAVVASVAAFLESAGLSRTLVALQSEAGLEVPSPPCTFVVLPFWCAVAEAQDWGISGSRPVRGGRHR
jgi:Pyruvate/2-oxoacid:ferredoxin oxidoreductase gamma subunit